MIQTSGIVLETHEEHRMLLIGAEMVAGGTHGCFMSSAIHVGSALSAEPKNNERNRTTN
jgi:hypothetical protein